MSISSRSVAARVCRGSYHFTVFCFWLLYHSSCLFNISYAPSFIYSHCWLGLCCTLILSKSSILWSSCLPWAYSVWMTPEDVAPQKCGIAQLIWLSIWGSNTGTINFTKLRVQLFMQHTVVLWTSTTHQTQQSCHPKPTKSYPPPPPHPAPPLPPPPPSPSP